jgi:TatD DNase family protein
MYLNFHTHNLSEDEDVTDFYNIDLKKGPAEFKKGKYQCLGIHPWDLTEKYLEKLDSFEFILEESNVICLGEMGLDRSIKDVDIDLQKKIFISQLNVAAKRRDRFVIIHCVKAYSEILECLKKSSFKGKLVFHDYNGDEQTTKDLVKRGYYFSYGNMLFFPKSKGYNSLEFIPIGNLFLETDDHKRFTIKDAYKELCKIKKIHETDLIATVQDNFKNLIS